MDRRVHRHSSRQRRKILIYFLTLLPALVGVGLGIYSTNIFLVYAGVLAFVIVLIEGIWDTFWGSSWSYRWICPECGKRLIQEDNSPDSFCEHCQVVWLRAYSSEE